MIIRFLTILLMAISHAHAQNAPPPVLKDFAISIPATAGRASETRTLSRVLPAPAERQSGQWVAIVVSAQTHSSQVLLADLQHEKLKSKRIVVIVLGDDEASQQTIAQNPIKEAQYVRADARTALNGLGVNGTPVLMGLNARNQIIWKDFGAPKRPGNTVVRILDWVKGL
jgi:hypothetical protein